MYIFGFGSLINIESAQKSFTRKLKKEDFIEVNIKDYKKVWNSIESIIFENEEVVSNGIFLNLIESKDSITNGVLLEINDEEFEKLKIREKNYSYMKIPNKNILDKKIDGDIFTFTTTNKEKIANIGDKNCFIPSKYIKLVEDGASMYSHSFFENLKNSINEYIFPIKDGNYKFSDPIQNKFAKEGIFND